MAPCSWAALHRPCGVQLVILFVLIVAAVVHHEFAAASLRLSEVNTKDFLRQRRRHGGPVARDLYCRRHRSTLSFSFSLLWPRPMPCHDDDDLRLVRRCRRLVSSRPAATSVWFAFGQQAALSSSRLPITTHPVMIFLSIGINQLDSINSLDQSFRADFYVAAAYQEKLLLPYVNASTSTDAKTGSLTDEMKAVISFPSLEIANELDMTQKYETAEYSWDRPSEIFTLSDVPELVDAPWVFIDSRFAGSLRAAFDLRNFPYDTQSLPIQFETSNRNYTYARFALSSSGKFMNAPTQSEWKVARSATSTSKFYYPTLNSAYHRAHFNVTLDRIPDYYVNKIVTGVVALVIMSAGVFTLDPSSTDRAGIAATAYLAVVTYLFIVTQDVPKVPYATKLDDFIKASQWFIFANYILQLPIMFMGSWVNEWNENNPERQNMTETPNTDEDAKTAPTSSPPPPPPAATALRHDAGGGLHRSNSSVAVPNAPTNNPEAATMSEENVTDATTAATPTRHAKKNAADDVVVSAAAAWLHAGNWRFLNGLLLVWYLVSYAIVTAVTLK